MWNLIYNNLRVVIDPQYFALRDIPTISKQVALTSTLLNYLKKTDPALCNISFYYPKYLEEQLGMRRVFNSFDKEIIFTSQPKQLTNFFDETNVSNSKILNELLSIAIENKIPFILSNLKVSRGKELDLLKKFNITILEIDPLQDKIKAFLQGFYNYYKFDLIYGIESPDLAHAMSDPLHNKLYSFEGQIKASKFSDTVKERIRSFVHNRYIDILVTIDRINFYKIQQQIFDIERNILDNKEPRFHGSVRYYLNYHLLLIWGYIDHLCFIINDVFEFGYNEENFEERNKIGLKNSKNKKEFLLKIKKINNDLYSFIITKEFQEWLSVLAQLRHRNAHREMISPAPLLQPTPASEVSDQEIDAIIYKDRPPIEPEIIKLLPPFALEAQKAQDRYHYRISKMEKIFDHVAIAKEGFFDPVARIKIDMKNIERLTSLFLESAKNISTKN